MDDQAAHQHSRHGFTRNTQSKCRNKRAARHCVISRLRAGHTFNGARAELFFMFGETACFVVTHKASDRGTGARQNTQDVADDPGAGDGRHDALDFTLGERELIFDLRGLGALHNLLFSQNEHLRHGEKADQGAGDVHTVIKRAHTKHIAFNAFHRIHADRGNQKTQNTRHQALQNRAARDTGDNGEAENREPEVFRALKLHGEFSQKGREEVKRDAAQKAAAEGCEAGHGQCFGSLPL